MSIKIQFIIIHSSSKEEISNVIIVLNKKIAMISLNTEKTKSQTTFFS